MSIRDATLVFSNQQDVAASTLSSGSTVISTNNINLSSSLVDEFGTSIVNKIGEGRRLVLNVQCENEAFAGGATTVKLVAHSAAITASTVASAVTVAQTGAIAAASAGIGAVMAQIVVPAVPVNKQFMAVTYTASGGNVTAGNATAWLGLDHESV